MDRTTTNEVHRFNETGHVHELCKDGEWKRATGVTTVLGVINKPFLIQWSADMAVDYIEKNGREWDSDEGFMIAATKKQLDEARKAWVKNRDKAGDAGTSVHAESEKYIKACLSTTTEPHPEWDKRIHPFIQWAHDEKITFLGSEKLVHTLELFVAGIADIILEKDGKRFIGDIKTGKRIYPEAFIQASAYAKMLEEMGEPKVDGVVIIRLGKDGGFDVQYNYDVEGNWDCFKSAHKLYRHLEGLK